jgi:hypothetical protein
MARPERFELPTYSSGGCRSIQLSYGRVVPVYIERTMVCSGRRKRKRHRNSRGARVLQSARKFLNLAPAAVAPATATRAFTFRLGFVHIDRTSADL